MYAVPKKETKYRTIFQKNKSPCRITDQSVIEREAPLKTVATPPRALYTEARGLLEVSFDSLGDYKWRHRSVFINDLNYSPLKV